jgi:hypothetical protein
MEPPKAAELMVRFHDAVAQGLTAGGLSVMSPEAVRSKMKLGVANAGCFEGACVATARRLLDTETIAGAHVKSVGKNYTIAVRLYRGDATIAEASGRCDICTLAEALEATKQVATETGSKAEEPPVPGAPAPAAPTEPARKPEPGKRSQVAEQEEPGMTTPSAVEKAGPRDAAGPRDTARDASGGRKWPLWPGIAAAGGGLLGIVIGAPLIAIDGDGTNCQGPAQPQQAHCAELYDTAAAGWVFTGMGIAAFAASGVLFYLHFTSKPTESKTTAHAGIDSIAVSPSAGGGMVIGATGRF